LGLRINRQKWNFLRPNREFTQSLRCHNRQLLSPAWFGAGARCHGYRRDRPQRWHSIGDAVERFRFGVALHVGRILYGNIGGGNRLDFTCIGPAVNLAARLEKIAGKLHRTIVASEGFAGICAGGWSELGEFPIAGFSRAERVYGLADETPAV